MIRIDFQLWRSCSNNHAWLTDDQAILFLMQMNLFSKIEPPFFVENI